MQAALKHFTTQEFWHHYQKLPAAIQEIANKNFQLLKSDPKHPSLQLKKVGRLWAVRVGLKYRALGADRKEGIIWFWIGSHKEYERLISKQ